MQMLETMEFYLIQSTIGSKSISDRPLKKWWGMAPSWHPWQLVFNICSSGPFAEHINSSSMEDKQCFLSAMCQSPTRYQTLISHLPCVRSNITSIYKFETVCTSNSFIHTWVSVRVHYTILLTRNLLSFSTLMSCYGSISFSVFICYISLILLIEISLSVKHTEKSTL